VHGTYNDLFFPLFVILLGCLFVLKDKYLPSIISFLAAFVFNPKLFVVIIILLIIFYEKFKSKNLVLPLIGMIVTSYFYIFINLASFPKNQTLHSLLTTYISDLGAIFGMGIFALFISLIGLVLSWKNKKENTIIYFALISLFISSLFDSSFILFIDLILAYYSGLAIMIIWNRKWDSITLKNYVLLLILCGVIFSSGSYLNRFSKIHPDYSEILSLEWLNKVDPDGKILSYYEYGFLIKGISGADTYTDKKYFLYSKDKKKINSTNEIFKSRDLKKITTFLDRNNIAYIWINEKMKKGQVWKKEDEGILLILQNSINFKKVYDYLGVEIWQYKK
jgi:hypothetical protein